MSLIRNVIAVLAPFVLLGCTTVPQTPFVDGTQQTYHALTPAHFSQSIAVVGTPDKSNSLEFDYARKVAESHLRASGFSNVVPQSSQHDLTAILDYAIGDARTVTDTYTVPDYSTLTNNRGQIVGYSDYNQAYTVSATRFDRLLVLTIIEGTNTETGKHVYEGLVRSSGSCGLISEVIDELIAILFDPPWPHSTGTTEKIRTPAVYNC